MIDSPKSVFERRSSMSDQPLLCKPALQREITGTLNIDLNATSYNSTNHDRSTSSQQPIKIIKSSGRNYGSFTNTACTDSFFQHKVQKDDSIQSIALKYNISIEQLKRINKLYSNEAFYFKDTILIPCPDVIPVDIALVSQDGAQTLMDDIQSIESKHSSSKSNNHSNSSPQLKPTGTKFKNNGSSNNDLSSAKDENRLGNVNFGNTPPSPDISDIFKRFDTALEVTRSNVEKLTQNSSCASLNHSESDEEFGAGSKCKGKKSPTVGAKLNSKRHHSGGGGISSNGNAASSSSSPSLFPESKRHDELYKL